jgi:hypothetical protein
VNEIERPRDAGEIIRDAFALYRAHPLAYLLIAFVVVVPVDVAVFGIGLGQLGGSYDSERSTGMLLLQVGVTLLVVTPLLTTMVIRALLAERPQAGPAIQAGLELFASALAVIVLAIVPIVAGFFVLLVPGIFLWVRLAFVVEALVIDGTRGPDALRRSWELTAGNFWRVLGITLLVLFLSGAAAQVFLLPFEAWGRSADRQGLVLAGTMIAGVVTQPFAVIASTLLYFDLRARRAA